MRKQPVAAGGGEPTSRARESGTVPSTPARHLEEGVHGVRRAVAPRYGGAGTSAAVAGDRSYHRRLSSQHTRVRFAGGQTGARTDQTRGPHGTEQSPAHGDDDGAEAPPRMPQRRPSYLPVFQRKAEEGPPHAVTPRPAARHPPPVPAPHADVPEEQQATAVVPAGVEPKRTFTTKKTIERISTLKDDDDGVAFRGQTPGSSLPAEQTPHHTRHGKPMQDTRNSPETEAQVRTKSPSMLLHRKDKERQPMAFCFTACCILFWLLVIAVGMAVLIIFLLYHPQSPKMRVTSATLNAGYVDELGGPAGGGPRALNADLTVLAAIYNPNTKLHILLRYMQLDLYFQGSMIGTQAVWPAPLHEGPRGTVLRSVRLVVSEVTMTQEDVFVWQNATTKGGPVVLHLAGRFRTQLIFGRWFRFKYWVTPQCTLWLDPPPTGALRRARC